MEPFGYVLLGIGSVLLGHGLYVGWQKFRTYRRKKKFEAFVGRLRASITEKNHPFVKDQAHRERIEKGRREVSELTFRDKTGELTIVRIIVDPDLKDCLPESKEELDKMLANGEAGTVSELMAGHRMSHDSAKKVQEFVFSPNAVRNMRSAGLEPDEVVTKMLRASGRID